jgi:hypothetical protein
MATEALTKFLRGSGAGSASVTEKLDFAVKTWSDDRQYIPGKESLLLEWVTSTMLRSCNNRTQMKNRLRQHFSTSSKYVPSSLCISVVVTKH